MQVILPEPVPPKVRIGPNYPHLRKEASGLDEEALFKKIHVKE